MRDGSVAPLTVKFQFRMTEEERKMLEDITQHRWPGSEHLQSLMLRRLIRSAAARDQKRLEQKSEAQDDG
jgi:hypothetical protein